MSHLVGKWRKAFLKRKVELATVCQRFMWITMVQGVIGLHTTEQNFPHLFSFFPFLFLSIFR
jgi:hypothetical protein